MLFSIASPETLVSFIRDCRRCDELQLESETMVFLVANVGKQEAAEMLAEVAP